MITMNEITYTYFQCKTLREAAKKLRMDHYVLAEIRDAQGWGKLSTRDLNLKAEPKLSRSLYAAIETSNPMSPRDIERALRETDKRGRTR